MIKLNKVILKQGEAAVRIFTEKHLRWSLFLIKSQAFVCPQKISIFTERHLCWSLFLVKLQTFSCATVLKRDSNTGAFL